MFLLLLAVVGVPALVAALVPDQGPAAEATVIAAVPDVTETAVSQVPTTGTEPQASTTVVQVSSHPTTTTGRPTTTTTRAAPTTTTTARRAAATTQTTPKPATPAPVAAPAPAPAPVAGADEQAFLACVRRRESGGNYQVVSSNGMYFGAYQFLQGSWDSVARHSGRLDLVGVPPNLASPADQDAMALALYHWQGSAPWGGACG